MVKTELIDEHVSLNQCQLAVDALLKHVKKVQEEKQKTELLPGREQHVWLVLNVKQMQPERKLKPFKIPIVHPLVDPRTSSVCLITKDPQREYKDLLEKQNIKFISRVVGVAKLKGKFRGFEERRMLLKENDLFLADERVIPLLPQLLGTKFFQAKKQPIPVNLMRKDLKGELERAISSTYFHQNQGTCSSIKIGVLSQTSAQILANLKAALPAVIKHIKGGWDNMQSLHTKTSSSASLPIWTCDLGSGEGGRWDGLIADDVEMSGSESESGSDEEAGDDDDEMVVEGLEASGSEDSDAEEVKVPKKGKKRAAEDEAPTPKKKAKPNGDIIQIGVKKLKRTVSAAKGDASPKDPATESAVKSRKSKKEKVSKADTPSSSGPSSSSVAPGSSTADSHDGEAQTVADNTGDSTSSAPKKKKKRASASPVEIPASSSKATASSAVTTSATTPTPVTPATTKKPKAARALAVDFFNATPASVPSSSAAPPPNTPADGLLTEMPASLGKKKKKGGKDVSSTPVSGAIEKLADAVEETPSKKESSASDAQDDTIGSAQKPGKKAKQKKRVSAAGVANVESEALVPAVPNKTSAKQEASATKVAKEKTKEKKRAGSGNEAKTDMPSVDTVELTTKELKQKRGAAGGEKKKEKVSKSKPSSQTAKEALIGKKGLQA